MSILLTQGGSYFLGFIFSHTHKRELQFLKNPLLMYPLPYCQRKKRYNLSF